VTLKCTRCGDEVDRLAPLNGSGTEACDECRLDVAQAQATKALAAPGKLEAIRKAVHDSKVFVRPPELRPS
jgi:hypothetical protein